MIKKILIFICLLTFIFFEAQAQKKETNNWIFGFGGKLTWNNTRSFPVTSLTGTTNGVSSLSNLPTVPADVTSNIATMEGCFALSDANGELLFYSDGNIVWDKKGGIISSNLGGHNSSTQAGVLMPYPGVANTNKYIIISSDESSNDKIYYAILTINNDKSISISNIRSQLTGHSGLLGESVNVIAHKNKKDFWITAIGKNSPNQDVYFNAWKVTENGVESSSPVVTAMANSGANGNVNAGTSFLKFSPDGKYYAWAEGSAVGRRLFFGEFDSETGKPVTAKVIQVPHPTNSSITALPPYGVEFSPSGKYLYVSSWQFIYVYNFNELLANPATATSRYFTNTDNYYISALQTSPDGRIYGSVSNGMYHDQTGATASMVIVDNPDAQNMADIKAYRVDNFFNGATNVVHRGLPSFSPSWFLIEIGGPSVLCADDQGTASGTYSVQLAGSGTRPTELRWYWDKIGQPAVFESQTVPASGSVVTNPYSFTSVTSVVTKTIEVEAYNGGTLIPELTQSLEVTIYPKPTATAADIVGCPNNSVTLAPTTVSPGATVTWFDAATGGNQLVKTATNQANSGILTTSKTFYMQVENPACAALFRIPVQVTIQNPATPVIASKAICLGETATLEVIGISNDAIVTWYTESDLTNPIGSGTTYTTPPLTTSGSVLYYAHVTNNQCSNNTYVPGSVDVNPLPTATLDVPSLILCSGEHAVLNATPSTGAIIRWYDVATGGTPISTGNSFTSISPLYANKKYYVEAYNETTGCTSAMKEIEVIVGEIPSVNVQDFTICSGEKATLTATASNGATLEWYDGSTLLATGATFETESLTANKTYQVKAVNTTTGCASNFVSVVVSVVSCGSKHIPVNPHLRGFYK